MLWKWHISFGFLFALILLYLLRLDLPAFLILFFSSWLGDLDHYFYYILKYKTLNPKFIYQRAMQKRKILKRMPKKQKLQFMLTSNKALIFHQIEIILILFFLFVLGIWFSNLDLIYAFCFLLGISFHLLLDLIEGSLIKERYSLILFWLAKRKNKN